MLSPILVSIAILLAPQQSNELLKKGLLELNQGKYQESKSDLEGASRADPNNPYIWSALAEVYLQTHEQTRASSAARQAEKIGAYNSVVDHLLALYYSHAGDFGKAGDWEARYAASPKADTGSPLRAAQWYLAANEPAKALPFAKHSIQADANAGFELVQELLRQQAFSEAAELLDSGLKAHPNDVQLTLALGVARYGQRRFDEAITIFLRVIQLDSKVEQPYLFLGRMLDQAGSHLSEITKDAQSWAEQNPQNAQAQLLLAKVLQEADPESDRIEALLQRSIQLDAANWEAHCQLGVFFESKHRYADAAAQLRQATELDAAKPVPHYHLARVYDRLGDAARAAAEREIHRKLIGSGTAQIAPR